MGQPTRVAIACQGGGAQTAFTAGALQYLLEQHPSEDFKIVALSGTSGGAICALFAWYELLTEDKKKPSSTLENFWSQAYPKGNSSKTYWELEALFGDWFKFWAEGHLPWLRHADRLRIDYGVWLLEMDFPTKFLPFHTPIEWRPYYFHKFFKKMDSLTPAPVTIAWEGVREAADKLPQVVGYFPPLWPLIPAAMWSRNFAKDCLDLVPFFGDSVIRREFDFQDLFRQLLARNLPDASIKAMKESLGDGKDDHPELLIGAVDVLRTHPYKEGATEEEDKTNFKVFRGSQEIKRGQLIEAVLASTTMPNVMRAVEMDGTAYWDGLYSTNPPIYDLPDVHGDAGSDAGSKNNPEQIWVIRINPMERISEPERTEDIQDRRNELAGNIALMQEIRAVRNMHKGAPDKYKKVDFEFIDMSSEMARKLKLPSKLDRRAESLDALSDDGKKQAEAFFDRWRHQRATNKCKPARTGSATPMTPLSRAR